MRCLLAAQNCSTCLWNVTTTASRQGQSRHKQSHSSDCSCCGSREGDVKHVCVVFDQALELGDCSKGADLAVWNEQAGTKLDLQDTSIDSAQPACVYLTRTAVC